MLKYYRKVLFIQKRAFNMLLIMHLTLEFQEMLITQPFPTSVQRYKPISNLQELFPSLGPTGELQLLTI